MAIWSFTDKWEKSPLYRKNHDGIAVVCGTSPWLTSDIPESWFRIGVNTAYKKLTLHAWIGLDKPMDHGSEPARLPHMKFYRGSFSDLRIGSVPVRLMPNSHFIDITESAQPFPVEKDAPFLWLRSSIVAAIQLAMYMGYSRIVLNGVDFEDAGKYADGGTCENPVIQQKWYDEIAESVKSIAETGKEWGFQFYSTRQNRLTLPSHTSLLT